jgi:arabinose-5-phosphate isomerase
MRFSQVADTADQTVEVATISDTLTVSDPLSSARRVLSSHISALQNVAAGLDSRLLTLAAQIAACRGQVIFSGIGKSAIAARKISASFSSHDIAATFMHASDALHGDLGVVRADDILIAITVSGATAELLPVISRANHIGAKTVAITANPGSVLSRQCDTVIAIPAGTEGCAFGIAPFASTLATIAIGDALTVLAAERMAFSRSAMAALHPGGHIGRQLAPVGDHMTCGGRVPTVGPDSTISDIIAEISAKGLGVTAVVNEASRLIGLITDGDLRRHFGDLPGACAASIMTASPVSVLATTDLHSALALMRSHRVDILPVVFGDEAKLVGMIHLQDILRSGIMIC